MKYVDKIIEIDPTASHGYDGKAQLYWTVYGRLDEAASWLRKGLSLDPNSSAWNAYLGDIYLPLGDDKQAECWINRAMKLGPEGIFPNLSMSFLHVYRNEGEQALPYARHVLKLNPTYPGVLVHLRDHDLRIGNHNKARSHYEKYFPGLLAKDEPKINSTNYTAAIDLAYVLQLTDEQDRANLLLDRSLAFIRSSGLSRLSFSGYRTADVQIYALRGEKQRALTTLKQAIDEGWRVLWRYHLEHNPNLESIRHEPEFQTMLEGIKAEMAEQLARVKEMNWKEMIVLIPELC